MGGQPCYYKLLMNGTTIALESEKIVAMVEKIQEEGGTIDDEYGYKMVEELNLAENAVFRAKTALARSQGFDGPFPHSMSEDEYKATKDPK